MAGTVFEAWIPLKGELRADQTLVPLFCLLVLLASCGKENPPRSRDEIFREKVNLPTLYLTAKTKKRVVTTKSQGNFLDKDTGELCWRAYECRNPNCPAKAANPDLFLFITPDPAVFIKPDGTLGFDKKKVNEAIQRETTGSCPECLKIRNLESESSATRERYASYVQPHVLPETAKRLKELDEEYKRRVEWEKKKK